MVKKVVALRTVEIPSDVDVVVEDGKVSVKGPLGEVRRDFSYVDAMIKREGNELIIKTLWPDKEKEASIGTIASHIENMITGVKKGFTYKLKMIFAHFPIAVKVQGDKVIIENFSGERRPRIAKIRGNVKVEVKSDEITVKGIDIEDVSQTAANIEQATKIKKRDPRVFLDGIYVYEKGDGM